MNRRPNQKLLVATWNAQHPPGTPVTYHSRVGDDGEPAVTLGSAFILSGHTAVVRVERDGRADTVSLQHVEVVP